MYIYYKNVLEGNENVTYVNNYVIKRKLLKGFNEYKAFLTNKSVTNICEHSIIKFKEYSITQNV